MKLLIADDEALVRQSIRLFLTDLGVDQEDIQEAGDGLAMVAALKKQHFDLALVDIRMPALNGLEAVRQAREISAYTDFYILSGFDDFQYAQEAIRLGVKNYILKPPKRTDLEEILEQTISSLELAKEKLMRELKLTTAALFNPTDEVINFALTCHPVLITDDLPSRPFSISELLAQDNDKILLLPYRVDRYVYLFLFELPEYSGAYRNFITQLTDTCQNAHTLIEGKTFTDSRQWKRDHDRMVFLAQCRPAFGSGKLYSNTCQAPAVSKNLLDLCAQCEAGLHAFACSDYAGFTIANEHLLRHLAQTVVQEPSRIKKILDFLSKAYVFPTCTGENLRSQLMTTAATMSQPLSFREFQYDKIIAYIQKHYMEDLSLSGLADLYGLSPNYFSTLFKKKAGCNFIHFLTELRMTESKRFLLETHMPIHEIAEKVGYSSTSFFIRSFKKLESVTPTEYRNQKGRSAI